MERIVEKLVEKILSPYPIRPAIEVVNYVREAVSGIVSGIFETYNGKRVDFDSAIENLMRYLATDRNFSPAESIGFLAQLKKMISEELKLKDFEKLKLSDIVDDVMLRAFNHYMACREKIFELRLKEKDRDIEIMRRIIEFAEKTEGKK